ncbi:membrane protein [Chryseobacterium formosense]|uniref:Membrane protein n=1 Tax=Chryseobacterium formosense TaxID=236814 RepID=A0A085Z0N0_9FLAO|nr:DUF4142 domain-containing protein [Chryseobacterium formosense]KFE97993.1 membrane protein [Chryseobacterium formosense]SFT71892.1 putative membrane protein [Chryseobacterium formosense]
MKNSILSILAFTAIVACKKSDTTNTESLTDTSTVTAPADTGAMTNDSTAVSNDTETQTTLSDQDKKFADATAKGGMMEVMAGQLTATNSTNEKVKAFGEMMVKDHTKANDELKSWAAKVGYQLPIGLDAEKQKAYDDLKVKKGVDFDRKYADMMVNDHKTTIADFKKQAADGTEASLKSFAEKTIPALEHHLMESEKTKAAVK